MIYDVAIVGGGPAGLSAALTARVRGQSVVVFEGANFSDKLRRAPRIDNYPGLPTVSGEVFMDNLQAQVRNLEPVIVKKRIQSVFPGRPFVLMAADEVYQAKSVILATGVPVSRPIAGESRLLGRGVSYCAVCDGNFFKDKEIAIHISSKAEWSSVQYLSELASTIHIYPVGEVAVLVRKKLENQNGGTGVGTKKYTFDVATERALQEIIIPVNCTLHLGDPWHAIIGEKKVEAIETKKGRLSVDGVFILREADPPDKLVEGLGMSNGAVSVGRGMETNIVGLYAVGDMTGQPLQVAKAVGEGQIAALSAVRYVEEAYLNT